MAEEKMPSGVIEVKAALELIEIAKKQGWLDRLFNVFSKEHTILVLGSSGVGKTNFIQSLTELVPPAIDALNRTQFEQKHKIKILDHPFTLQDTPGQEDSASRRTRVYQEALRKGISGVINVTASGYHEGPASKADVFENGKVKPAFLTASKALEIEALHEWTTILGAREVSKWLITAVSKADLWWHDRVSVLDYYKNGPYSAALGGAKTLNPVVLPYCSVAHKFYGEDNTLSSGFDDADRVKIRAHFLSQLVTAAG